MASLPPISALLTWAKDGSHGAHSVSDISAGKRLNPEMPAPVTQSLIDKAQLELPQGSAFALKSCLNAWKVISRLPPTRIDLCPESLPAFIRNTSVRRALSEPMLRLLPLCAYPPIQTHPCLPCSLAPL